MRHLLPVLVVAACGSKPAPKSPPPPPAPEADAAPTPAAPDDPNAKVDAGVRAQLESIGPALQTCWEDGKTRDPKVASDVNVSFTIEIDGTPRDVSVVGVGKDQQSGSCFADRVLMLHFDPPADERPVKVGYRYHFPLAP